MASRKQTKSGMDFAAVGDAFEALAKAVAGPDYLPEPPRGFFSREDYARRTGVSVSTAGVRLRKAVSEGKVRSVLVKNGCALSNYYGPT